MALLIHSWEAAPQRDGAVAPSCGGWYESSLDLHRGVDVIEDVSFEDFERCRALGATPQSMVTRLPERSRRLR